MEFESRRIVHFNDSGRSTLDGRIERYFMLADEIFAD
jgi:hypothetical protein